MYESDAELCCDYRCPGIAQSCCTHSHYKLLHAFRRSLGYVELYYQVKYTTLKSSVCLVLICSTDGFYVKADFVSYCFVVYITVHYTSAVCALCDTWGQSVFARVLLRHFIFNIYGLFTASSIL